MKKFIFILCLALAPGTSYFISPEKTITNEISVGTTQKADLNIVQKSKIIVKTTKEISETKNPIKIIKGLWKIKKLFPKRKQALPAFWLTAAAFGMSTTTALIFLEYFKGNPIIALIAITSTTAITTGVFVGCSAYNIYKAIENFLENTITGKIVRKAFFFSEKLL